ncbi:hypothetical protein pdam_00020570 [Pocillopora damicornis]|uniref:Uncharacterized protein n=1 Tax=Pocillopora damicornis TaxID=46731 RepID=A0A3M6V3F3_POCDA|nr:hypothetical protein pdam_00020570 [Pocillopora damicornis]
MKKLTESLIEFSIKKSLSRTKEYTEDLNDNKYNVIQCKEKIPVTSACHLRFLIKSGLDHFVSIHNLKQRELSLWETDPVTVPQQRAKL